MRLSNHLFSMLCLTGVHFLYFELFLEDHWTSSKLDTNLLWLNEEIHIFFINKRSFDSPWGDNREIVKVFWQRLKNFWRTTRPTNGRKKEPRVKRIQKFVQMNILCSSLKRRNRKNRDMSTLPDNLAIGRHKVYKNSYVFLYFEEKEMWIA